MKIRKALSVLVSTLIFITAVPIKVVSAENDKNLIEWDGTADTTWYDGEETEQHINSSSQLAGLAKLVNEGRKMEGQTIILDNDISLKNHQWTPIGIGANSFSGTFDGNNHIIYEMNISFSLKS